MMATLTKLTALLVVSTAHPCTAFTNSEQLAVHGQSRPVEQRVTGSISNCGLQTMAATEVSIAQDTDHRRGFDGAVQSFCELADGQTVKPNEYISMATEVFLNAASNPAMYGVQGLVYFEVHNKATSDHKITTQECSDYLLQLSADGGKCSGSTNHDTKGGTFQVGNEDQSYHALGNEVPPKEDGLNKLFSGVLSPQIPNKGSGPPLDPWPYDSFNVIQPTRCHSHNDYDRSVPLYLAMSAGCISFEADVHYSEGTAIIGHDGPEEGRSLSEQYVLPLRAVLDHNNGGEPGEKGLYPPQSKQSVTLVVEFKSSEPELFDAVMEALQPLRDGGYLSSSESGTFEQRAVTVVLGGKAPFDRIDSGDGVPDRDVIYGAPLDDLDSRYTSLNSFYAAADWGTVPPFAWQDAAEGKDNPVSELTRKAHDVGLRTSFWNLPGPYIPYLWDILAKAGVDRFNADDMYATARLPRIE